MTNTEKTAHPKPLIMAALLVTFCSSNVYAQGVLVVQAENTAAACQDGVDNDRDGHVDCQDQDCGMIVTCANAGPRLPGPLPPRPVRSVGTGRGMAVSGIIVSSIGLAMMTAAVVVGSLDVEGSDDGQFFATLGVGVTGFAGAQVGNGLIIGALRRVRYSSRTVGAPSPMGSIIAGWILWGLALATPGINVAIMETTESPIGVTMVAPLTMTLATFATVVAGWSAGAGRYRAYAARQQASSLRVSPFLASTSQGSLAGIVGTF